MVKHTKQIRLSPSKLSSFLACKRCFWLNVIKGVRYPSGPFPSLPGGMDSVLKKYFDDCRARGVMPSEIKGKLKGKLFDDADKLAEWRNNRHGLRFTDKKSGIELMGAVDDMFVAEDGCFIPIDFKTRGWPIKEDTHEHYQHQMDIYAFLLEKNGVKTGGFACLLFYHPTKAEDGCRFQFKSEFVKVDTNTKRAAKLFRDAIKLLQGPEPKAHEECEWCSWGED